MGHVVLLGDSIFDNARYVPGRPAVIEQLRTWLPRGWRATLLAVDGSIASDVLRQVPRLPSDCTHLVLSAGGNDALQCSPILNETALSASAGFVALAAAREQFLHDYRETLDALARTERPVAICTVYDSVPGLSRAEVTGLCAFNDVILREGARHKLPILDLRLICDDANDYSSFSPIEPSEIGGAKIVQGIKRIVTSHDFDRRECVVYGK